MVLWPGPSGRGRRPRVRGSSSTPKWALPDSVVLDPQVGTARFRVANPVPFRVVVDPQVGTARFRVANPVPFRVVLDPQVGTARFRVANTAPFRVVVDPQVGTARFRVVPDTGAALPDGAGHDKRSRIHPIRDLWWQV